MQRITIRHLNAACEALNRLTNSPLTPWNTYNGKSRANIGNYHISRAYGGFALHRMMNESGGIIDPFHGHMPARELLDRINAYMHGFRDAQ